MKSSYARLGIELVVESVIMYFVMYAMVDVVKDIHVNANNLYMTMMMAAPMGAIMLLSMNAMYKNKPFNVVLFAVFVLLFLASYYAIRSQSLIGDKQFLQSMIPHHSAAILMCRKATLADPEVVALCGNIKESQQRQIDEMEGILKRY